MIDYIWYTSDDFEVEGVLGGFFHSDVSRDIVRWIREGVNIENQEQNNFSNVNSGSYSPVKGPGTSYSTNSNSVNSNSLDNQNHSSSSNSDSLLISIQSRNGNSQMTSDKQRFTNHPAPNHPSYNQSSMSYVQNGSTLLSPYGNGMTSRDRERVWSVLGNRIVGFPNPSFPSDHIPVMAELRFKIGETESNEKVEDKGYSFKKESKQFVPGGTSFTSSIIVFNFS